MEDWTKEELLIYRGPDYTPVAEWVPAPEGYVPVEYGSVFPPIKKLPDNRLIIDQCRMSDGTFEVKIFDNKDHPNIALLPASAPRAVVSLYERSSQLSYLRMTSFSEWNCRVQAAAKAWDEFEKKGVE